jgi:hypothetical protein
MNFTTRYILMTLRASLYLWWSGTAAAAAVIATREPDALALDPMLIVLSCVISTLSGGTALAIRVNALIVEEQKRAREAKAQAEPFIAPWLFAVAHMGGSWLAGVMAFLLGKSNDWGVWTLLLGVLLMSFAGAKAIEMVAEKWLAGIRLPGAKE